MMQTKRREREAFSDVFCISFPVEMSRSTKGRQSNFLFTSHLIFIIISYHIAPRKILRFFFILRSLQNKCWQCPSCCGCLLPFSERQAGKEQEGESCYIELVVNRQTVCIRYQCVNSRTFCLSIMLACFVLLFCFVFFIRSTISLLLY